MAFMRSPVRSRSGPPNLHSRSRFPASVMTRISTAGISPPSSRPKQVTRPNGASLSGPEEIRASHEKSFTRFEGSQHFVASHDISLDGNTANVRANLIAMHMWQGSKADANKLDNFFV